MSGTRLRKYNVQTTVDFEVFEVDGVDLRTDWTPAQSDCEIMKDGGASTQCSNTATDEGSTYSIVLTATEMQAARLVLKVVDSATKQFLDTVVHIETYGNASALHAFDLDTATQDVNAVQISGDSTAADNLELMYDGTGYAGGTTKLGVDAVAISGDTTAANNLELQYDGTGLLGDPYPLRQDQGAGIAGGLAIRTAMASVTVIQGSEQGLSNTTTSDDSRWTGDDDDDGGAAEFIFRCTPTDNTTTPVDLHFEGYYDEPSGATNGATLEVYNFQNALWDTVQTFATGSSDVLHDSALLHGHSAPGSGTLETVNYTIGDVLIKFSQDTQETGDACLLIDYMTVGFVGSLITASAITDDWESQSQTDPTGFHVNLKEVNGTNQTAGDIVGLINTIDDFLDTEIAAIKAVTDDMKTLDTTIASVDTADTVFRVNAGLTGDNDINNAACSIYDTTGGVWSGPRRVSDYVHSTLQITIDANTAFPLAAGDRVVIWNVSYATTAAAGAITGGDLNDIADAVWDETGSDHNTVGTTGAKQERSDRTDR